jgi:wyosine [tRNA(Phe)-imidazoG37] synthetase (radical SAM superfamily)
LDGILNGIRALKNDFGGKVDVQMMFMPANIHRARDFVPLLQDIAPDTIQLNTPKRPYPLSWHRESRGNHHQARDYETRQLRVITQEEAKELEETLRQETGLKVLSVYRE